MDPETFEYGEVGIFPICPSDGKLCDCVKGCNNSKHRCERYDDEL